MNIQVHDTTGASPYELVFSQKARTVIFPTQQNATVLEEDLADEGTVALEVARPNIVRQAVF